MTSIKVICLGSNDNPATTEGIEKVRLYLDKNNGKFPDVWPEDWPSLYSVSLTKRKKGHALLVKIGSYDRPATDKDIDGIQKQLAEAVNDPSLTIITHHNFTLETIEYGIKTAIVNYES